MATFFVVAGSDKAKLLQLPSDIDNLFEMSINLN